jgi:hypothetical protein
MGLGIKRESSSRQTPVLWPHTQLRRQFWEGLRGAAENPRGLRAEKGTDGVCIRREPTFLTAHSRQVGEKGGRLFSPLGSSQGLSTPVSSISLGSVTPCHPGLCVKGGDWAWARRGWGRLLAMD